MRGFIRILFCMFLVVSVFCVGSVFAADNQELLADTDSISAIRVKADEANAAIERARYASVRFDLLQKQPDGLKLSLFDDVVINLAKTNFDQKSEGQYSWFGTVSGIPYSNAILTVVDGELAANITMPGAIFQIRPVGGGVHGVYQIDQSQFQEEAPAILVDPADLPEMDDLSRDDDGSVIDVLVAYTQDVTNPASTIALAIDETNQSYANSGIQFTFNLVHSVEVNYTESGILCNDTNSDLTRLWGMTDGYMDELHTLRNRYKADLVVLLVESGNACGCAYTMSSVVHAFERYAFAVVKNSCATGYYSFGHETGHNMGTHHDQYVCGGAHASSTYAHGYVYTDQVPNPNVYWRTVMAYNTYCSDNGFYCNRLQYWSNPEVTYGNPAVPMGVDSSDPDDGADNQQALDENALTVSNFRDGCDDCEIDGLCYADGEANPDNACEACDVATSAIVWTALADSSPCDDGIFCNGDDTCVSGACDDHTGDPCGGGEICNEAGGTCDEDETSIELISFEATELEGNVSLTWETATETGNAGYHLLRSLAATGAYQRITNDLLPSEGTEFAGASYEYTDHAVAPGETWFYKLEEVDINGLSTFHGPAVVTLSEDPEFGCGVVAASGGSDFTIMLLVLGMAILGGKRMKKNVKSYKRPSVKTTSSSDVVKKIGPAQTCSPSPTECPTAQ